MSALVHLIYTSVQTFPLDQTELAKLVQDSRVSNQRNGITGILLHVSDTFFQVLEGDSTTIEELYAKILLDRRHTRVTRIIYEPIPHRFFGESTMTLASLSPHQLAGLLEEKNPVQREELLTGLGEGRAKKLLRAFTDGRWRTHADPGAPAVVRT